MEISSVNFIHLLGLTMNPNPLAGMASANHLAGIDSAEKKSGLSASKDRAYYILNIFKNSSIIHEEKTKEVTAVSVVIPRVYKKNATSEFPKKSTLQFLSVKDFRPMGIEIECK